MACSLSQRVEVLLFAVGVSYRRLLLQFSQELETLLTAAAVPARSKRRVALASACTGFRAVAWVETKNRAVYISGGSSSIIIL